MVSLQETSEQENSGNSPPPHCFGCPNPDDPATNFRSLKEILEGLSGEEDDAAGSKEEDLLLPADTEFPPLEPSILEEIVSYPPEFSYLVHDDFTGEAEGESEEKNKKIKKCCHCEAQKTTQWRAGPNGVLCNACGLRYTKTGKLEPEYRPAKSPTFSAFKHSNKSREIKKFRQQKGGGDVDDDGAGWSYSNSK